MRTTVNIDDALLVEARQALGTSGLTETVNRALAEALVEGLKGEAWNNPTSVLPSVKHYLDFVQTAGLPIMAILAPLPAAVQAAAWQDIETQLLRFNSACAWVGPNELLLCTATRPMQADAVPH